MSFWTGLKTVARSFPWTERVEHKPWTERSHLRVRDARLMAAMGMPSVDAAAQGARDERGRAASAVADARAAAADEARSEDRPVFDFENADNADEGAYR